MPRKLAGGWLRAFLEWTLPRSEAPRSMVLWSGLFTLAAVMKRKVFWPEELLGSYTIFPNFYVVFVGEPAVVRKSTTTGYSERLLNSVVTMADKDKITFGGDVTSASKILDSLNASPDSSVCIVASEFSSLVQATPEATYEILTDIFDNRPVLRWKTWAHGDKDIEQPVVNLIAATTPAWISEQPPKYFVGGGLASRILFLLEEKPRQREIYYDHLDGNKLKKLEVALQNDLLHIAQLQGTLTHDAKTTKENIRAWYKKQSPETSDSRTQGYYGRKHVHLHKIAALLSVAERDDLKVTQSHFDEALRLLDYIEERLPKALSTVGANPYTQLMNNILDFVQTHKSASFGRIAGRFYLDGMTVEQLRSALQFLVAAEKLKMTGSAMNPTFHSWG